MPLVTTTEMFKKAYDGGYAIGAFNVNNMEIVQGITEACKEEKAPVILQVSKGARAYANHTYLMYLRGICIIDNDLDKFCNEHCKTCGTQRCEGVYSEEWRNGCKEYNEQLNSHANLCDVGDIFQRYVKENT